MEKRDFSGLDERFRAMLYHKDFVNGRLPILGEGPSEEPPAGAAAVLVNVPGGYGAESSSLADAFRFAAAGAALLSPLPSSECRLFLCDKRRLEFLQAFVENGGTFLAELIDRECQPLSPSLGLEPLIPVGDLSMDVGTGNAEYLGAVSEDVADYLWAYRAREAANMLNVGSFGIYDGPELVRSYAFGWASADQAAQYEEEIDVGSFGGYVGDIVPASRMPRPSNAYQEEAAAHAGTVGKIGWLWISLLRKVPELRWRKARLDQSVRAGGLSPGEAAAALSAAAEKHGMAVMLEAVLGAGVPASDVMA